MVKTTVYLPEELKRRLSSAALAEGRSEAELIRDAVDQRVRAYARPRPRLPLTAAGFGDPDAALRVDELLRGGFGQLPPGGRGADDPAA